MIEILDGRPATCFKTHTFSRYQSSAVKNELIKALTASQCEAACYWSAELICSGHFVELWNTVLFFFAKHVHVGNPKLPLYLEMRFTQFKTIASSAPDELGLRLELKRRWF